MEAIIRRTKKAGIRVALLGMMIPPNYGQAYTDQFREMYPALAKKHRLPLLPFLLKGVAGNSGFNIEDGIHPNPAGHRLIAALVYDFVAKEGLIP